MHTNMQFGFTASVHKETWNEICTKAKYHVTRTQRKNTFLFFFSAELNTQKVL